MKSFLLNLLKQSGSQEPYVTVNPNIELTGIGGLIIGLIAGVIITLSIMALIKMLKVTPENKENNKNDNDKKQ